MKYTAIALLLLTSACASSQQSSRRSLSSCARDLVEQGYLSESLTAVADKYCTTSTPAQIACAKHEYESRPGTPFAISETCAHAGEVAAPPVVVARSTPEPTPTATPAPTPVAETPTPVTPAPDPTPPAPATAPSPSRDVIAVAAADEDLSTFVRLLDEAGLTPVITQASAVTLLAPTNAALAKFPFLAKNKERLRSVLSMHVIMEAVTTADAPEAPDKPKRIKTLGGRMIPLRAKEGVVSIGRAKVVRADVPAANGGLEVIDTVLQP